MSAAEVRQRVPFRYSEDDDLGSRRVLDEQEQEEVIDRLRKKSARSGTYYWTSLQAVIGMSLLNHFMYLFSSTKISPLANVLPGSPSSRPVPFTTGWTVLQIIIHINLSLNALSPNNTYLLALRKSRLPYATMLPLPLMHPATIILPVLAPAYALALGRGLADVLWWALTGTVTVLVAFSIKWMRDEDKEIAQLEKLRYEAKGA